MKYSQLVTDSYADQIGTIDVMGQSVQLCDHMENIDGTYYATSFALSADDRKLLKDNGAQFSTMDDQTTAVYIPAPMLAKAAPVRAGDAKTQAMIERLAIGLASANSASFTANA